MGLFGIFTVNTNSESKGNDGKNMLEWDRETALNRFECSHDRHDREYVLNDSPHHFKSDFLLTSASDWKLKTHSYIE